MTQHIPVVFCFDAKYAPYAAVAAFSVVSNTQSPVKIYWIAAPAAQAKAQVLRDHLLQRGIDVSLVDPGESPFDRWKPKDHVTTAGNLRLLIPDFVGEDRVIYLDCDTMVLSDLAPLYETDMKGLPLGGVTDPDGPKFNRILRDGSHYINSGVLLMDLKQMRAERLQEKCAEIYARYGDAVLYPDQCVLNKYAEDRTLFLDPRWNRLVFTQVTTQQAWRQAIAPGHSGILHFIGPVKPWEEWCNPLIADFWWERARKLGLEELQPVKITDLKQVMSLAYALDTIEQFQRASSVKTGIITRLIELVSAPRSP
jgi:lipopolysaccharide biosynthesis glycosyltransferase